MIFRPFPPVAVDRVLVLVWVWIAFAAGAGTARAHCDVLRWRLYGSRFVRRSKSLVPAPVAERLQGLIPMGGGIFPD
jgi:hypothetical protein